MAFVCLRDWTSQAVVGQQALSRDRTEFHSRTRDNRKPNGVQEDKTSEDTRLQPIRDTSIGIIGEAFVLTALISS